MRKKSSGFTVYSTHVPVAHVSVPRRRPTLVGLLLLEDIRPDHVREILGLNALVSGYIIVTLNRSGLTAIKWHVPVSGGKQAQIAAITLAKIVSKITGITSTRHKLRDRKEVARALAA